jgi:hypothetical protein
LLDDWIGGGVGHSPCRDVCVTHDYQTVKMQGQIYYTIPEKIIIKAGLSAAYQLVIHRTGESC